MTIKNIYTFKLQKRYISCNLKIIENKDNISILIETDSNNVFLFIFWNNS